MCLKKLWPRPLPLDAPSIIPGMSATVYDEKLSRLTIPKLGFSVVKL